MAMLKRFGVRGMANFLVIRRHVIYIVYVMHLQDYYSGIDDKSHEQSLRFHLLEKACPTNTHYP